jgi:hypothetical protein
MRSGVDVAPLHRYANDPERLFSRFAQVKPPM